LDGVSSGRDRDLVAVELRRPGLGLIRPGAITTQHRLPRSWWMACATVATSIGARGVRPAPLALLAYSSLVLQERAGRIILSASSRTISPCC
jgi:hypothetical protein